MDDHHAQLWRARAATVRHSPLKPLAAQLGYHKDPLNRARWKRPGSVLSITGSKFFDHCCGRGGGGAIDLVMHAQGCCFTQAVRWLEGHPGPLPDGPAPAASRHSDTNLRLPSRDDRNWPRVCDYLVQARGLCPQLLGRCLTSSILYADQRSNAVFLCRNSSGTVTGAEIVGSAPLPRGGTFKGMAPGSRKSKGGFWLPTDTSEPRAVLLTESAIDSLSAYQLLAPTLPPNTLITSTAGVCSTVPGWLQALPPLQLLCGYDADRAGDEAAQVICSQNPRASRLLPHSAKDWNDLLLQSRHRSQQCQLTP